MRTNIMQGRPFHCLARYAHRKATLAWIAVAVLGSVLLSGTAAQAANQGITGKKLLLKTGKLVLISKDAAISIAGSDPVNGADSSVSFDDGGGSVTFSLPKTLWSTKGSGAPFKYKNAAAPGGPSVVKIAKVKPGLLKVVAKGLPFAVPNGAATIDVVLSLDPGTNTFRMTFHGMGDGDKFLATETAAGGAVCGNNVKEGSEQCDGSDATACPGSCQANCTCPAQSCGNNVREGSEQCDGGDATACPGSCQANCTCPAQSCGNNLREGSEQCDGGDATACPGSCQANCTCPAQSCGNNVREGSEQCDGGDATACPGSCQANCTCPATACPATGGDTTACLAYTTNLSGPCHACMDANAPGSFPCPIALGFQCLNAGYNDSCSADVNTHGCGAECCPPCGNNVREGTEVCDGTDDATCPGQCQVNCMCPGGGVCGNGIRDLNEQCDGGDSSLCLGTTCEADCTCGYQPVPCGGSGPLCGNGSCSAGQSCIFGVNIISSGCVCIPTSTCNSGVCSAVPEGTQCPPGYEYDIGFDTCLGGLCGSDCSCPSPGYCFQPH